MKKSKHAALRWIIQSTRFQLPNIILLAVMYGLHAFLGVYNTGFARQLVDAAVSGDFDGLLHFGLAYLIATLIQILALILSKHFSFVVSTKLEMRMKSRLFRAMLDKEYASVTSYHSGELMNRLTNDVTVVSSAVTLIVPNLVFFLIKTIGIFYIMISIDVLLTMVFAVIGVVVFFAGSLFKPVTKRIHKDAQESDGKVRSFMQESLGSLLMIKTFDAQNKIDSSADALQDDNYAVRRKRNRISILTGTSMTAVFSLGYVWGLIWGAFNIFTGAITFGTLTQIITLVGQVRMPIQGITSIFPAYFNALASAERIMEIEQLPDEEQHNETIDREEVYDSLHEIVFRDISFAFDRDEVLEHTSLSIQRGDFVVIEGISGIGKSTLLKLLLSVYRPLSGEIFLRTENERIHIDKNTRPLFAYVPQGNFLLSGTLRENIAFVAPDATDELIMHAARIACAESFISELPQGLDTTLTERGGGLSEGQIQRVAIARAILSSAPVILLDEATSALDEETEHQLLTNLRELQNKTCIIVSHKKAAEEICNRRITIVDKKIIE